MKYIKLLLLYTVFVSGCGTSLPLNLTTSATKESTVTSMTIPLSGTMPAPPQKVEATIAGIGTQVEQRSTSHRESTQQYKRTARPINKKIQVSLEQNHDKILDQLTIANIAFNIPTKRNIEDQFVVQLMVDLNKSTQELVQLINKPEVVVNTARVSKIVTAALIAPTFKVIKITSEEQVITTETTVWEWELIPTKVGPQEIKLTIDALINVDNTHATKHIKTFEQTIIIDITHKQLLMQYINQYGQWVWTTLLLPLLMWSWKKYKN